MEGGWWTYNPITLDTLQRLNFLMFPQFLGIDNIVGGCWSRNKVVPPQLYQKRMGDFLVARGVEWRIRGLDCRDKTCKVSYSAPWRGDKRGEGMNNTWLDPGLIHAVLLAPILLSEPLEIVLAVGRSGSSWWISMGWVCWGFGTEPIVSCWWEAFFLVYELGGVVGWKERQLMRRNSPFWERAERRTVG